MPTFAHTESGSVLDPMAFPSEAAYRANFNAAAISGWQIVQVPDGTPPGATPDGQGGWAGPAAPVKAPAQPAELSGTGFHNYVASALAVVNSTTGIQGMDRLGMIVRSLRLAAANAPGLLEIAYQRYTAAAVPGGRYTLADATTLLGALQAAGTVTAQEAAGVIQGWPTKG